MCAAKTAAPGTGLTPGGVVAEVTPGSPAERAGIAVGERVMAAGGEQLHDVLDWSWYASGTDVLLTVASQESGVRDVTVTRATDEPWGIAFSEALFDGVRTCRNRCAFCFLEQLPAGLRQSLYVRDDDFRLSFLDGNFITATNLSDADVARIAEQRLSPLYVSVHAVTPEVRAQLLCVRGPDTALTRVDELLDAGIDLHAQIVLVPGVNDGEELDRTLNWLAEREGVLSVGVVPLGYTRHQARFDASYGTPEAARGVLRRIGPWQEAFRREHGITWVQAADELYLKAGAPLPPAEEYDGFPQYENGIGIARAFVDEWHDATAEPGGALRQGAVFGDVVVVTGELAVPLMGELLAERSQEGSLSGGRPRVLAVRNEFLGGNVNVTGLLVGADIVEAVRADARQARAPRATYLLPDVLFNAEGLTLDDRTLEDIREATGANVRLVSSDATSLAEALFGRSGSESE